MRQKQREREREREREPPPLRDEVARWSCAQKKSCTHNILERRERRRTGNAELFRPLGRQACLDCVQERARSRHGTGERKRNSAKEKRSSGGREPPPPLCVTKLRDEVAGRNLNRIGGRLGGVMAVAQATARAAGPGSAPALLRLPLRLRGAPARPRGRAAVRR